MIAEWREVKLEELGTIGRGKSKHRPRNADILFGDKYPFVQTADVKNAEFKIYNYSQMYSAEGLAQSKLWPKGTLCITIAANIADSSILGIDACFPDSVVGFTAHSDKSDVRFVKYLFDLLQVRIKQISQGAAQDNLSLEKIRTLNFLVPPLETQTKIASILSGYDDLIENNLKRINILEEMAQQTYEEWFVRMRFPGYETARFDLETGLPEGWEKGKLNNITDYLSGYAFKSSEFKNKGNGIIRIKNIGNNTIDISDVVYINDDYAKKQNKFLLKAGDLLIAMTGATVGKVGIMPFSDKKFYLNQRVGKLITENTAFLNSFFNSTYGINQIVNIASGAAQPNISAQQILDIELVVPKQSVLQLFAQNFNKNISTVVNLQSQNQRLREARDILLPRLMMGVITV
ncbi:restriction endonuclease subunit S [Sphingobacterium kitahiroshimense]|uniref:Restriction endonuclease subunit S n=1 Tax=Sphingobacterium kitahiroshimense TaxID=470446 RepID=A0ABV0BVF2_9SPHI